MAGMIDMLTSMGGSIDPLMRLISGGAYIIGFWFIWLAIKKTYTMADYRARSASSGRAFIPLTYLMGGLALLYLPSFVHIAQNTFFGLNAPLAYANWLDSLREKYGDPTQVLIRLVQLSGIIWFVRGVVLLVHASEPGVQHGPRGMAFLVAGILAMNLNYTINLVAYVMSSITELTV